MTRPRIEDVNRRDLNFKQAKVRDVLPEYFVTEYPKLISLLDTYYQFLDSTGDHSFKTEIDAISAVRDGDQNNTEALDKLIAEIGDGLQSSAFFDNPRLMVKLLSKFYRSKGTVLSAEGFFRAFFNEEASIEYPKTQIFTINDKDNNFLSHEIGFDSQKFIQDNRRFQVFSILVKAGISVIDYENLYKKFVHPAGFYFEGEVALSQSASSGSSGSTGVDSDEIRGLATIGPKLTSTIELSSAAAFTQTTGILESDGRDFRINVDDQIQKYGDLTASQLSGFYTSVAEVLTPNSFTFDDSAASDSSGPDTTITVETMDNTMFTRYLSDSAF